jgi:two-component system, NtrC family, response regulator
MPNILIVDDDKLMNDALSRAIKRLGHNVTSRLSLRQGLGEAYTNEYDVIYLDVRMPDGDGLENLPEFRGAPSSPEIIIMTGFANSMGAELAIKSGAWDYVKKPSSINEMILPLLRALQYRKNRLKTKHTVSLNRGGIIGSSPEIKSALDVVAHASSCDANVLINGATGTGKELFAWAIHNNSSRSKNNFVVVDCTVLPETLVESLLFGHEKGSFTGASMSKEGLIEQADGGTVFLDEVGELPLSIQKKFLRVLQERHFRPVGSKREVSSDFRLITATNRDLSKMVNQKRFRKDLFFRIHALPINLPTLHKRKEDIRDLLVYYMDKLCEKYKIPSKGFSPEFLDSLLAYEWPGNVRELINTLESIIAEARNDPILFPYHLPIHIRIKVTQALLGESITTTLDNQHDLNYFESFPTLREYRDAGISEIEKKYLNKLMKKTSKDIKEACNISGLSRSRIYGLMKKYNITRFAN